jgi:hypothetical protein
MLLAYTSIVKADVGLPINSRASSDADLGIRRGDLYTSSSDLKRLLTGPRLR